MSIFALLWRIRFEQVVDGRPDANTSAGRPQECDSTLWNWVPEQKVQDVSEILKCLTKRSCWSFKVALVCACAFSTDQLREEDAGHVSLSVIPSLRCIGPTRWLLHHGMKTAYRVVYKITLE